MTHVSRRGFLAGGAGLAASALLAGCGSNDKSGAKGSPDAGVINVWGGVPEETGPGQLIEAFTEKYPKIKVNYTRYVNDDQGNLKLDTALQGGAAKIDVYISYGPQYIAKRVNAGLALDLTNRVKDDTDLAKFAGTDPQLAFLFDGKLYGIPTNVERPIVIMNQDLLDAANITIPDGWTVDDYHEIARELSSDDVYGSFGGPPIAIPTLGGNAAYKKGGQESNFDDPAWRDEIQMHVDMIDDESAFPHTEVLAQKLDVYQQSVFLTGKYALWISGPWVLRYVNDTEEYPHDFVTAFAPLPAPEKGKPYFTPTTFSSDMQISPKSDYQEAAWTFVRYSVGEGAKHMIQSGRVPVTGDTPDEAIEDGILGPDKDELYDVEAFRRVFFEQKFNTSVPTIQTAATEIAEIQGKLTDQVLLGQISVDEWVSKMKSQCDDAIKKAG